MFRAMIFFVFAALALTSAVDARCHVDIAIGQAWEDPGTNTTYRALHLALRNFDEADVEVPYDVAMENDAWQDISDAWNFNETLFARGMAVGTVVAPWANLEAGGQNIVEVGCIVKTANVTDGDVVPKYVNVDGEDCDGNITYLFL